MPHHLLHDHACADHGTLRVANNGVDVGVGIDGLENFVHGLAPDVLMPLLALPGLLEQADCILGVYAVRHVAQTAQILEVVSMTSIHEAEERARPKVVFPTYRWVNLMPPLSVGEGREATLFKLIGQRPQLNAKVLISTLLATNLLQEKPQS